MRVLQLCSYYIGNELYKNLFEELSLNNIELDIFIPIKKTIHQNKNKFQVETNQPNFYYEHILNSMDRIFFKKKIRKQVNTVESIIKIKDDIDIVHAHTLFSDGATAYFIYNKYNKKYIVNVRNTDINIFWKYGIHLRKLMYKILIHSEQIVFLSPVYKEKLLGGIPENINRLIIDKCIIVPNGIDKIWHNNELSRTNFINTQITLLYIGALEKNKNVDVILKTLIFFNTKKIKVFLNIVGTGSQEGKLKEKVSRLNLDDQVKFYGYLKRNEIQKTMLESDIFIMPSFKETFGLVYIEAMSMGLPVIYTKNEGIDGYFKQGEVGYAVNPTSVQEIYESVELIIKNYKIISKNCVLNSKSFNWKDISEIYISIYENIIEGENNNSNEKTI